MCDLSPLALFVDGERKLLLYSNEKLVIHDPETKSNNIAFPAKAIRFPVCYYQSLISISWLLSMLKCKSLLVCTSIGYCVTRICLLKDHVAIIPFQWTNNVLQYWRRVKRVIHDDKSRIELPSRHLLMHAAYKKLLHELHPIFQIALSWKVCLFRGWSAECQMP